MARPIPPGPPGVWHVDFEYETYDDGTLKRPFLMAAVHHTTGRTFVLWDDELAGRPGPPFPVDGRTIVVCHHCPAEAGCFAFLGWPRPPFLDTMIEFRLTAAYADWREEEALRRRHKDAFRDVARRAHIFKLYQMARALGFTPPYDDAAKEGLQRLAASGCPSDPVLRRRLAEYCISDTLVTRACLPALVAEPADYAAAAMRAEFALLCEEMAGRGHPVDGPGLADLVEYRLQLRRRAIEGWDRFGLYRDGRFSLQAFLAFLDERDLPWPSTSTGRPDTRRETFREQARIHPIFAEVARLRDMVAMFKKMSMAADADGRLRTDLRPFASKTGRSCPSSASCLFLQPKFLRPFIQAPPGMAIIQADYSQQEILIAGVLSDDGAIIAAYREGDCYVGLGKQLGLIPGDGTKKTHPAERHRCKTLMLGILYLMSAEGLAMRLGMPGPEAHALHRRLHETFAAYFAWTERVILTSHVGRPLVTSLGWKLHARSCADNSRTRANFLIQSTGSDILHTACLLAARRGLQPIMTVHDSVLIQAAEDDAERAAGALEQVMSEAATTVLGPGGEAMRIDLDIVRAGQRLPVDEPDLVKYQDVRGWIMDAKSAPTLVGI